MPATETAFDRYVAIDWSGSRARRYSGIAVAQCNRGDAAPQLLPPPGPTWTRQDVLEWLLDQAATSQPRLLVGFDFAFCLPSPGCSAAESWRRIDATCGTDPDLQGQAFIATEPRFWTAGRQPPDWARADRHRAAEEACLRAGLGRPLSPYQLIGAKQVGKGALSGQRLLHQLTTAAKHPPTVWPFQSPNHDRHCLVEIYPRLFIRHCGLGNRKLDIAGLNLALQKLQSQPCTLAAVDDHQADALVSAAGLRAFSEQRRAWCAGHGQPEGWIFGVPTPGEIDLAHGCNAAHDQD